MLKIVVLLNILVDNFFFSGFFDEKNSSYLYYNNSNVFTVTFGQSNATLLNKI